ncbi:MAG: hypothetical protein ACI9U2_001014 [Bradymonadia bacterium]|jgi:hypothetical protein
MAEVVDSGLLFEISRWASVLMRLPRQRRVNARAGLSPWLWAHISANTTSCALTLILHASYQEAEREFLLFEDFLEPRRDLVVESAGDSLEVLARAAGVARF